MAENKRIEIKIGADAEPMINALKHGEAAMGNFGSKSMAVLRRTGQAMNGLAQKYMNGMTYLVGGAGIGYITKNLVDFNDSLVSLGITSNLTSTQVNQLRQQIVDMISPEAKDKIPATKEQLLELATALSNTGVKIQNIRQLLPQMAKGAVAAGVNFGLYGEVVGDFVDKYKVKVEDLGDIQNALNETLKLPDIRGHADEYLQSMQQILKSTASLGIHGKDDVKALLAMQATLASVTGSAQAANSEFTEMVLGMYQFGRIAVSNRQSVQGMMVKEFKQQGINFFDKKGNLVQLPQLIQALKKAKEVAKKYHVDLSNVFTKAFTGTAGLALAQLADHIDDVDAALKHYDQTSGSVGNDYIKRQQEMSNKLIEFKNELDHFTVTHMTGALKELDNLLNELEKHPLIAKSLLAGTAVAGGALVGTKLVGAGKKMYGFGKDIFSILRGKKGVGGILGKVEGMAGATPVYVVNMSSMNTTIGTLGSEVKKIGTVGKVVGGIKKIGGLAAGGIGSAASATGAFLATDVAAAGAGAIGGTVAVGGALGVAIGLGIDKAIGSIANKYSGGKYNGMGALGEMLYDYFHKKQDWEKQDQQNNVVINLHIDAQGKAVAESNSPTTRVDAIKHGSFFPGVNK